MNASRKEVHVKYIALALLLTGCATPIQFTDGGRNVQPINTSVATSCKHLGLVESFKPVLAGGLSAAHIDIRNKVAARSGNAMVVNSQYVEGPGHGNIIADAYRCP
jgi:hypothetical protein